MKHISEPLAEIVDEINKLWTVEDESREGGEPVTIESQLAEMQRRTIERTRLEEWVKTLTSVDVELVSLLEKDERDVACAHIRKAIRAIELRANERGCSKLVEAVRAKERAPDGR